MNHLYRKVLAVVSVVFFASLTVAAPASADSYFSYTIEDVELDGFIITGFSYDLPDGTTITPPDGLAGDDIELGSTTLRLRGDSLENVRLEVVIDDITIDSADDGLVIYNDVTVDSTEFNIEVDGKAILLTDIEITNTQVGSIVFAGFTIQEDIALGDTTVDDITVVDDEIASDLFGGFWDDVWPF